MAAGKFSTSNDQTALRLVRPLLQRRRVFGVVVERSIVFRHVAKDVGGPTSAPTLDHPTQTQYSSFSRLFCLQRIDVIRVYV